MKYLFDHNLAPSLAHGLHGFSAGGHRFTDLVIALRDKFPADTPDPIWISQLGKEGNWAVVTQDLFRKNSIEKQALKKSGLIVFALSRQWPDFKYWDKAKKLVEWWPHIEAYATHMRGGVMVRVPWRCTGRFQQIRI